MDSYGSRPYQEWQPKKRPFASGKSMSLDEEMSETYPEQMALPDRTDPELPRSRRAPRKNTHEALDTSTVTEPPARKRGRAARQSERSSGLDEFDNTQDFSEPPPRPHMIAPGSLDVIMAYTTLALVGVGLASVFTASAVQADMETGSSITIVIKQMISAVLGTGVLLATARVPFDRWRRLAQPFGGVAIGLLLLTMVVGNTANGSERWIMLPFGFTFQPSDLAKVAAIFLMAQATSQRRLLTGNMVFNFMMIGLMIGLILKQPNLSVSIILVVLSLSMLTIAGLNLGVLSALSVAGVFGAIREITHNPYQMARISGWLDPWKDAQDKGYNLIQSYYAIGSGGLFGVGMGNSIQKLYYLPFQHTDFIFAVICEEWGFIGASIVLGLFAVMGWRGFAIAWNCPNRFGKMLAFGLTMAIVLQAMINVCVTIGLMPVTGVTLPLISYGGTSMMVTLGMIGILLNISKYRHAP